MTVQEAVEILMNLVPQKCKMVDGRMKGGFPAWDSDEGKALIMAKEALEKQDAKKYKTFVGEIGIIRITYYECPCCGEIGIEHMQKHCHECGQKLDWGE